MQFRATHFMSLQSFGNHHSFTRQPFREIATRHKLLMTKQSSKRQCLIIRVKRAPCQFICLVDTFYGKNKPDSCQRDTFRAFFNYSAIKLLFVSERLSYFRIVEKIVFVQVFFVKRLYVGLCGQPRLFERRFCP